MEYQILRDETEKDVAFLYLDEKLGCFYHDAGEWIPMSDPDDLPFDLEQLNAEAIPEEKVSAYIAKFS